MRPVDSHCHLQFEQFDEDRKEVIEEVEEKLEFAVLAGCNLEDNKKTLETASKSDSLKYCLGLHPLYSENSDIEKVRAQIRENSPVAVGEIGLDYNYITDKTEREHSEKIFRKMLETAEEQDLGVVIHSRNAERKAFEIVQEYDVRGFFHCFNGDPELAREIADEGHFIGVTGQILHSTRVQNIVESLNISSILTETDSPYLGPEERNTPLTAIKVANEIAKLKDLDQNKVLEASMRNSEEFFV